MAVAPRFLPFAKQGNKCLFRVGTRHPQKSTGNLLLA